MNSRLVLLTVICAFLPAGAQRVRVDFDHAYHFSRFKTYCWIRLPDSQPADLLFPNQIMQGRIGALVDEALAGKGLKRVESNADLTVGYQVMVTEEPVYTTINDGWAWGWNGGISTTTTEVIYHSTLVVDVWDARQAKLLFQGTAGINIGPPCRWLR